MSYGDSTCPACLLECEDGIQCEMCLRWSHFKCQGLSDHQAKILHNAVDVPYHCRDCRYLHGEFRFERGLERLAAAAGTRSFKQYCEYASVEASFTEHIPLKAAAFPDRYFVALDTAAAYWMQQGNVKVDDLAPLQATGDGNCLFNSVSVALWGNETMAGELRHRVAVEMAVSASQYQFAKHDEMSLVNPTYKRAAKDSAVKGNWSCAWTIQSLAHVISAPIHSHYPWMNGHRDRAAIILNKVFNPMTMVDPGNSAVHVLWSKVHVAQASNTWTPNHFVPLVPSKQIVDPFKEVHHATNEAKDFRVPDAARRFAAPSPYGSRSSSPSSHSELSSSRQQLTPPTSPTPESFQSPASSCSFQTGPSQSTPRVSSADPIAPGGRSLPGSKYLSTEGLLEILSTYSDEPLPNIPGGRKENQYFIIDNQENLDRRLNGTRANFTDDCGAWSGGPSPITRMTKTENKWQTIVFRSGKYGMEKRVDGNKEFVAFQQQPEDSQVLKLHQSYNKLKADAKYTRRVSWIEQGNPAISIVEYRGIFPGHTKHGNSQKRSDAYMRTHSAVFKSIERNAQTAKPRQLYTKLNRIALSEQQRPADLKQVQNKMYNLNRQKRQEEGAIGTGKNLADNFQQVENMVQDHPYVQHVIHRKNHVPAVILYTQTQIADLKRFCCSAPIGVSTVIGVDKTYNLGELHVTPMVFKHLGLVRPSTNTHPIFLGPVLIHGNSDVKTYSSFFHAIALELDIVSSAALPVFGSDDEKAIRSAIKVVFGGSRRIACERHLKKNATDNLANKVGASEAIRKAVVGSIFGESGITSSASLPVFEERLNGVDQLISQHVPAFESYFQDRLLPILRENFETVQSRPEVRSGWTNNNSESMNHVLKMNIQWRPQTLPHLIESLHDIVEGHDTDVERAVIGRGEFRLADGFEHFYRSPAAWCAQSSEQRANHLKKFRKAIKVRSEKKLSVSSDGDLHVLVSAANGRKPGQTKRKRNSKTTYAKKARHSYQT